MIEVKFRYKNKNEAMQFDANKKIVEACKEFLSTLNTGIDTKIIIFNFTEGIPNDFNLTFEEEMKALEIKEDKCEIIFFDDSTKKEGYDVVITSGDGEKIVMRSKKGEKWSGFFSRIKLKIKNKFFLKSGSTINKEERISVLANRDDKEQKSFQVLMYENEANNDDDLIENNNKTNDINKNNDNKIPKVELADIPNEKINIVNNEKIVNIPKDKIDPNKIEKIDQNKSEKIDPNKIEKIDPNKIEKIDTNEMEKFDINKIDKIDKNKIEKINKNKNVKIDKNKIEKIIDDLDNNKEEKLIVNDKVPNEKNKKKEKYEPTIEEITNYLRKSVIFLIMEFGYIILLVWLGCIYHINDKFNESLGTMLGTFIPITVVGSFMYPTILMLEDECFGFMAQSIYFIIYVAFVSFYCFLLSYFTDYIFIVWILISFTINYIILELYLVIMNFRYIIIFCLLLIVNAIIAIITYFFIIDMTVTNIINASAILLAFIIYNMLSIFFRLFIFEDESNNHPEDWSPMLATISISYGIFFPVTLLIGLIIYIIILIKDFCCYSVCDSCCCCYFCCGFCDCYDCCDCC